MKRSRTLYHEGREVNEGKYQEQKQDQIQKGNAKIAKILQERIFMQALRDEGVYLTAMIN